MAAGWVTLQQVHPGRHRGAKRNFTNLTPRPLQPYRSMLKLEHIYKSFEGKTVLSDVSLTVPKGVTHALIGSSGSGKTTLLRVTLGLIPFERGYVKINDQALLSFTPMEWADRIGYVPQDGGLFPHITGRQNVALVPQLRNWAADRIDRRVEELRGLV